MTTAVTLAATLARMDRDMQALRAKQRQLELSGGGGESGGSGGGLGGFSINAEGNLILTYAGSAAAVSIDATGHLQLEI